MHWRTLDSSTALERANMPAVRFGRINFLNTTSVDQCVRRQIAKVSRMALMGDA